MCMHTSEQWLPYSNTNVLHKTNTEQDIGTSINICRVFQMVVFLRYWGWDRKSSMGTLGDADKHWKRCHNDVHFNESTTEGLTVLPYTL